LEAVEEFIYDTSCRGVLQYALTEDRVKKEKQYDGPEGKI
jgi:hypothetical protein